MAGEMRYRDLAAAVKRAYTVRARRWSGGWELHILDAGVTQVSSLARAKDQVRDYLATLYDLDASGVEVTVVPELGDLGKAAAAARQRARDAVRARREATEATKSAARQLREAGLSVADTAAVLEISKGRVSQLASSR